MTGKGKVQNSMLKKSCVKLYAKKSKKLNVLHDMRFTMNEGIILADITCHSKILAHNNTSNKQFITNFQWCGFTFCHSYDILVIATDDAACMNQIVTLEKRIKSMVKSTLNQW